MPSSIFALEFFRACNVIFLSVTARGTALDTHIVLDAVVVSGLEALLALFDLVSPFVVRVVNRWRPLDVILNQIMSFE